MIGGDHSAPDIEIGVSLPSPVAATPKLKIFRSIVVSDAVLVVNGFVLFEFAAKQLLHYSAMLWLFVAALFSIVQNNVAGLVDYPSTCVGLSFCIL
jgi:hypothetical protein